MSLDDQRGKIELRAPGNGGAVRLNAGGETRRQVTAVSSTPSSTRHHAETRRGCIRKAGSSVKTYL